MGQFFSSLLLSPEHFGRANEIMKSKTLISCIGNDISGNHVGFVLPKKCPVVTAPKCTTLEETQEVNEVDPLEAPPVEEETTVKKTKGRKGVILVESEVRRSPRTKKNKNGFKDAVCMDKNCVGCNSKPPTLSNKVIRKLSSSLCDVEASLVTDEALGKTKKAGAPSRKNPEEKKSKKKKVLPLDSTSPKVVDEKKDDDED